MRLPPNIHVFEVVPSTNDTILAAGEGGAPEGTVHIARAQTRGRGRGDRAWWSPPGAGLWMSVLLRPRRGREAWGAIALVAGAAVRRALSDVGVPAAELRWPNDIFAGGKKLGGILCEARARAEGSWLALGIGIDIDIGVRGAPEMPADLLGRLTSLVESGSPRTTDPVAIALEILDRFWPLYRRFEAGEDAAALVGGDLAGAGREVEVAVEGSPPWRGTIEGLGDRGELLVRPVGPLGPLGTIPPGWEPPGGAWSRSRAGVVAVTGGRVAYVEAGPSTLR
jgi:BirA family biotin operon repressor/biotin-[acetyl-CoA-carboxylase] ligase